MNAGVIVVGAGPTGLMLAGELAIGGVDVTVYDSLAASTGESRALGFNRRVAESFDQRGLLARLGDFIWGPMSHFGGVRIDLGLLDENHSGVLGLPQARTEQMLGDWLAELGVPVRRGYEVTEATRGMSTAEITGIEMRQRLTGESIHGAQALGMWACGNEDRLGARGAGGSSSRYGRC
jgi:2-polyprenyl-6-methoxyphenol hydroxylase-like FAD-dependent oxidoreductase